MISLKTYKVEATVCGGGRGVGGRGALLSIR